MSLLRWASILLVVFALVPAASRGIDGALDDVPAGLLLLPYFEVDLDDPNGPDTVWTVHNNSAGPILSDVVLFTDWGIETLQFTIFLGPFSVQEIRMRDVFSGLFPNIDATPGCPTLGPIDAAQIAGAVAAHRGVATALSGNNCAAQDFGDGLLRGFGIAVFPSICSAFAGGSSPAVVQGFNPEDANILWGDYTLIERDAGVAAGELLPALEFRPNPSAVTSGGTTPPIGFLLATVAERLPRVWGVPFSMSKGSTTEVIVFNLPPTSLQSAPCGSTPTWYPQGQAELRAFDEDGASVSLDSFRPFPAVTNRVTAGPVGFPVPYDEGWLRADLTSNPFFLQAGGGAGGQGEPFTFSYVAVLQRDDGLATLGRAIALPTPSEQ